MADDPERSSLLRMVLVLSGCRRVSLSKEEVTMKRIWSIEEQTVREPATGFFLEFTSAPTETSDGTVTLNIWNEGRTRKLVIQFARHGLTQDSSVDHARGAPVVPSTT